MKGTIASTAVMARRAPSEVESDSADERLYRALDYFPTPPWAARAGAELMRALAPDSASVWEPACGEGHMAAPFGEYFGEVYASDIHPHGFGEVVDFLAPDLQPREADWVASNPPFKVAEAFLQVALERARVGVALLLRLSFLEGQGRHASLWGDRPLSCVAPFAERVPMRLGRWDLTVASATAYAWFIWLKDHDGPAVLMPIAPGTRERLWLPDDAERFGWRPPMPLFDAEAI